MKFFISIVLICISFSFYGQHENKFTRRLNEIESEKRFIYGENRKQYMLENIEGSMYLTDEFTESKIYFKNDDTPYEAKLKYNIYNGSFEYKRDQKIYAIANANEIEQIIHKSKVFIHTDFPDKYFPKDYGFIERLTGGPFYLFKKYNVEFHEEEPPASSFHDPKPARFDREDPEYFLKIPTKNMMKIKSFRKKKILSLFNGKEEEVKEYMRKNNLNPKKEQDLIKIIQHYNELIFDSK